jgi:hypothetical protein
MGLSSRFVATVRGPVAVVALILVAAFDLCACSSRQPAAKSSSPVDLTRITDPCQFLTDADREALGLGAPQSLGAQPTDSIRGCAFNNSSYGETPDKYVVERLLVWFLDTSLDVARTVLEHPDAVYPSNGYTFPYVLVPDRGFYRRADSLNPNGGCDTLFSVTASRQVRFVVAFEPYAGSDPCVAADHGASLLYRKIPAHPLALTDTP